MNKGNHVLVVDDEPYIRELVAEQLTLAGYRVDVAQSGHEAIDVLKSSKEGEDPFDLVVSDVRMPDGSGVELLDQMRALWPELPPFVFHTGYSDVASDDAFDRGASAILMKPAAPEEMIEAIRWRILPRSERWKTPYLEKGARLLQKTFASFPEAIKNGEVSVGVGGLFIRGTDGAPAEEERVQFSLQFGSLLMEGKGICRWVRPRDSGSLPAGFGLEILALSEASIEVIERYIAETKISAYIPRK